MFISIVIGFLVGALIISVLAKEAYNEAAQEAFRKNKIREEQLRRHLERRIGE